MGVHGKNTTRKYMNTCKSRMQEHTSRTSFSVRVNIQVRILWANLIFEICFRNIHRICNSFYRCSLFQNWTRMWKNMVPQPSRAFDNILKFSTNLWKLLRFIARIVKLSRQPPSNGKVSLLQLNFVKTANWTKNFHINVPREIQQNKNAFILMKIGQFQKLNTVVAFQRKFAFTKILWFRTNFSMHATVLVLIKRTPEQQLGNIGAYFFKTEIIYEKIVKTSFSIFSKENH